MRFQQLISDTKDASSPQAYTCTKDASLPRMEVHRSFFPTRTGASSPQACAHTPTENYQCAPTLYTLKIWVLAMMAKNGQAMSTQVEVDATWLLAPADCHMSSSSSQE